MKSQSASSWRPSDLTRPVLLLNVVSFPQLTSALGSTRASLASSQSHRSFPRPQPSPRLQQLKSLQTRSGRLISSSLLLPPRTQQEKTEGSANKLLAGKLTGHRKSLTERRMVPLYRLAVEFNKGVKLRQLAKGRAGLRNLLYVSCEKEHTRQC